MQATEFEFRYRALTIITVYSVGLLLYKIDHTNVVSYVVAQTVGQGAANARFLTQVIFGMGAFFILLAAIIRTWAAAYLSPNVVQDPGLHSDVIVADGPYRHVRNPLYLGAMLQAYGLALLLSRAGFFWITIGMTIFFFRLIGLEETKLEREQGASYREFRQRVPRSWPALKPRVPKGTVRPQWTQGFFGEIFMWGFCAGMATWAVTLQKQVAWIVLGTAFALYIVRSCILYSRRKKNALRQQG